MAAAADRLSALPDDLLQRILSFAPAKWGACTAVLARRWRPVWRRAGAVSLDSNLYDLAARSSPSSEPFLRDAVKLLEAFRRGDTELKWLTLLLDKSAYHGAQHEYYRNEREKQREAGRDRVGSVLLAHPSAADLEELTVRCRSMDYRYRPWLSSLPCAATLRVLELTRCDLHPPPSAAAPDLPCLTDLRLRLCVITEGYLQVVVDAAPALTSLVMVHVSHKPAVEEVDPKMRLLGLRDGFSMRLRLRSPTVTALELEARACEKELEPWANPGIELDMPSLRSFRFSGCPVKLSLTSPAPALARVDLDVSRRDHNVREYEPTSRMLKTFSSTRALKLRLPCIEDVLDGEDILPTFHNLELLEVNGHFEVHHRYYSKYRSSDTAVAMARLLRSCPAMSELRLCFKVHMGWDNDRGNKDPFVQSMERFNTLAPMSSTHRDAALLGGVSDLPDAMANNCAFSCLQKTLRKVTLKFAAKEVNCFQVQLAKFIVENAMVLQEMHVDDGDQFCADHLYNKLARWRADSFQRRNLPETVGFRVY